MSFCISKDMGKGNRPSFFGGIPNGIIRWGMLSQAATFKTEREAQLVIDAYYDLMGCIVMPFDEPVDMSNQSYSES